jgi:chromosomal replication initiator protein DnaA
MDDKAGHSNRSTPARPSGEVVAHLRDAIGATAFERYFAPAPAGSMPPGAPLARIDGDEGRLRVRVSTPFAASLIKRRFGSALDAAANASGLGETTIELDPTVGEPGRVAGRAEGGAAGGAQDVSRTETAPGRRAGGGRRSGLAGSRSARVSGRHAFGPGGQGAAPDGPRLESFAVGTSNRAAYNAATRVADARTSPGFATLVIYGACGVGKTHLLRGIAARYAETGDARGIRCTTAEAFTNDYIEAVRSSTVGAFQKSYRRVSLLCIDDIHFLATRGGTQKELLHTFDALDLVGARVVLVSDEHPRDIKLLSEPLVSRFVGGAVTRIDPPEPELAVRLVEHLATRRRPDGSAGLRLADGAAQAVVDWTHRGLADRGRSSISARDLSGAVSRVRATAEVSPELIGADGTIGAVLVDAALSPSGGSGADASRHLVGPIRMDRVVEVCADALEVEVSEVLGRGRHRRVVLARALAAYLGRRLTNLSTPEIALKLGRNNHSTVVTASRRLAGQIESGERVRVGCTHDGATLGEFATSVERRVRAGR